MDKPIDTLLPRLEKLRDRGGGQYLACCPAHKDDSPSLSIRECDDGRILLKCFAGCPVHDIVAAVGLEVSDLFPDNGDHKPIPRSQRGLPRSQLESVAREVAIVALAADDVAAGQTISTEDAERVALAAQRVREAARAIGINI